MVRIIIYAGLSIPFSEAKEILDSTEDIEVIYKRPIKRGDLGHALKENPDIIGLIVSSFYIGCACGLIDYLIRKKECSKILPAAVMLELQEKILKDICWKYEERPLKMILWEANDPEKMTWDDKNPDYMLDCMNPQKRVNHIKRTFDCKQIGITYAQAPLCAVHNQREIDEKICSNLLLFLYKATYYNKASAEDLEQFLISFSQACNGHFPDQLHNAHIDKMMRQIAVMKRFDIPLLYERQTEDQRKRLENIPC